MDDRLLWYTTRGAGAVTLVLLTAVVVLGVLSVLRFEAPGWPRFLTAGLHRNLALATVAFLALHVVTAVVGLLRRRLGHRGWRAVHWLTYLSWPVAVVHGLGTGTDSGSDWLLGLDVVCVAAVLLAVGCRLWPGSPDPLAAARSRFRAATARETRP